MWSIVEASGCLPKQRSLHAAAVFSHWMYIFGGFDGFEKLNDLYKFDFDEQEWAFIRPSNDGPCARDRATCVNYQNQIYIFGGCGQSGKMNDFWSFDTVSYEWRCIQRNGTKTGPSPRHSHCTATYKDAMLIFGGVAVDDVYKNDFHKFSFVDSKWAAIHARSGNPPGVRFRSSLTICRDKAFIFGGHNGVTHLNDLFAFDFNSEVWIQVGPNPCPIAPRDSHSAVVIGELLYIFGGSTGTTATNELLVFDTSNCSWECRGDRQLQGSSTLISRGGQPESSNPTKNDGAGYYLSDDDESIRCAFSQSTSKESINSCQLNLSARSGQHPCPRFCHTSVVYDSNIYVFGGYDGNSRLSDFLVYAATNIEIPSGTLVEDLKNCVGNENFSDVQFRIKDELIPAHKVLLSRSAYFRALLSTNMKESTQTAPIEISSDIVSSGEIFRLILECIYSDNVQIPPEHAMELLVAADHFEIQRLKCWCEITILSLITVENAPSILLKADRYSAKGLRSQVLNYIIKHFDAVSKYPSFADMGRQNYNLILEILERR